MFEPIASALFDDDVVTEEIDPRDVDEDSLWEAERVAIQSAVQKRRRQFSAGRFLARRALGRLGLEPVAIIAGQDRAPQWPVGVVGSISHTDSRCVVAMGLATNIGALGIDVEPNTPLKAELMSRVCVSDELRTLDRLPEAKRGHVAKVIFSAKEAAYKCQYPRSGKYLGFHAMCVRLVDDGTFEATFLQDAAPFACGDRIVGRHAVTDELIVTGCSLPSEQ